MAADRFELQADFQLSGDQPRAVEALCEGLDLGLARQTLLGVTGSGKTYTLASVVARQQRPALVLAPNKTLAAQLYGEFRDFFPRNRVEYFVSYYDYYQPEAYVPSTDTYIEKDASINSHIEQMRLSATKALMERKDTIVVATVSAIYGLGDPDAYFQMILHLVRGDRVNQRGLDIGPEIVAHRHVDRVERFGALQGDTGDALERLVIADERLAHDRERAVGRAELAPVGPANFALPTDAPEAFDVVVHLLVQCVHLFAARTHLAGLPAADSRPVGLVQVHLVQHVIDDLTEHRPGLFDIEFHFDHDRSASPLLASAAAVLAHPTVVVATADSTGQFFVDGVAQGFVDAAGDRLHRGVALHDAGPPVTDRLDRFVGQFHLIQHLSGDQRHQ